ncbi:MAG: hypothetical protein K0Q87_2803 [Neobacillus sp.]|jgi:hypothetical protein|nr:hypothetical protein [Neobacillus sp.]
MVTVISVLFTHTSFTFHILLFALGLALTPKFAL